MLSADDRKLLRCCRRTRATSRFTLLEKMGWPKGDHISYQLRKLLNMGLVERVAQGEYKLTKDGKINSRV